MENASKALIIAGAILLAILIIGLGVFIYNQASNTVSDTGMDQVAIRQFNGQFEPYINKTVDSTAAKALIDTVNQSNKLGKSRIELPDIANKSEIKIGHKYTTEARYSEGVISAIEIIDANNSSTPSLAQEHNIIESTSDFNARFDKYIGANKSISDIEAVEKEVSIVNELYGQDREAVILLKQKEPSTEGTLIRIISVENTYSDGKYRTIGISYEVYGDAIK